MTDLDDAARPYPADAYPACPCWACDEPTWPTWPGTNIRFRARMSLCPTCGNKRCPGAADHTNACTGSNEAGQAGSLYGGPVTPEQLAAKRAAWCDELGLAADDPLRASLMRSVAADQAGGTR